MTAIEGERNLDDKVYIICYEKGKWADEIANEIWGIVDNRRTTLSKKEGPIRRLIDNGYMKEILRPENVTANRRYYISTPSWIIDELQKIDKIRDDEINKLTKMLSEDSFRNIIKYDKNYFTNISAITDWLSFVSTYIKFLTKIKQHHTSKKIDKNELYKKIDEDLNHFFKLTINSKTAHKTSKAFINNFATLKTSTINKIMKTNPYYIVRFWTLIAGFEYGRHMK